MRPGIIASLEETTVSLIKEFPDEYAAHIQRMSWENYQDQRIFELTQDVIRLEGTVAQLELKQEWITTSSSQ